MVDWTSTTVETLNSLVAEKHSAGQIAAIMSRLLNVPITRNSIIGKCHRDGISLTGRPVTRPRLHKPRPDKVGFHKRSSQALPKETAPPVEPLLVPLVDLRDSWSECRAVIGEATLGLFCGHDVKPGSSYCPHHADIYTERRPARGTTSLFRFGGKAA
jgi:hypothetical protein